MTVTAITPGLIPIGFFDVSDSDLPNISGGEILVFDTASSDAGETSTAEVYSETNRSNLRLADGYDTGPFFIASSDKTAGNIGFEKTSLYATNTAYAQTYDSSSKVGVFGADGFYALTIDKFASGTVTSTTLPNTKLYATEGGLLTTVENESEIQVAFFIEYRESNKSNYLVQPFTKFGMNRNLDTVIIYKSSINKNFDGYEILNHIDDTSIHFNISSLNLAQYATLSDLDGYSIASHTHNYISTDEVYRLLPETIGNDGYILSVASGEPNWLPVDDALSDLVSSINIPTYTNLNIPYAAQVTIDFAAAKYQTVTSIAGPLELVTSNRNAVMSVTIFLECNSIQTLTFPPDWRWLGSPAPTQLEANTLLVITLTSRGTNESDIIAAAASEV